MFRTLLEKKQKNRSCYTVWEQAEGICGGCLRFGHTGGEDKQVNTAADVQCCSETRDEAEGSKRIQGWVTALGSFS